MSEENLNVIQRAFDAYAKDDIDAVLALCSDDIVITQAPEMPGVAPELRGHQGVLEAFGFWPGEWDDSRIEVDAELLFVFAVRGGRIAEWQIFLDEDEALAAAGVGRAST